MRRTTAILLIAWAGGTLPVRAQGTDAVAVAPEIHRIVLDNLYVRVLETRFHPGSIVPMHSHPGRVVVVLSPARTRVTSPGARPQVLDRSAGEVFWSDSTTHGLEAIAGDVREIEVEIKPSSPAEDQHSARGVPEQFPELARVLVDNRRVRVVDLRAEPGQVFPLHYHPSRVTVRLGDARMIITEVDGRTRWSDMQFGATSWGDAVQHSDAVVLGVFHVIDIELKPSGQARP